MTGYLAVMLALAFGAVTGPEALAQEPAPEAAAAPRAAAPLWLVECVNQPDPARLSCAMSQSIVLTQGNQRLATAAFGRLSGDAALRATMTLPVGLRLTMPPVIQVDEAEIAKLGYQSCDMQGCYATAEVDSEWLAAMRGGQQMNVRVTATDGREIDLGFPLAGFSAAADLMP